MISNHECFRCLETMVAVAVTLALALAVSFIFLGIVKQNQREIDADRDQLRATLAFTRANPKCAVPVIDAIWPPAD